jgi:hypothetical protein
MASSAKWKYIVALAASVVITLSAFLVIPYFSTATLEQKDNIQRIVAIEQQYNRDTLKIETKTRWLKVGDMAPDSSAFFLSPFATPYNVSNAVLRPNMTSADDITTELRKSDIFALYEIIRLPDWLGGGNNDISSYRAYSAVSVSDQCIAKYWPDPGRYRIENPCAGDMYRPWDGFAYAGPAGSGITGRIVPSSILNGLPTLDLTVDSQGYIAAKKPNEDLYANGSVGEGHRFTAESLDSRTARMVDAASAYAGYRLPIPASINGIHLSELQPLFVWEPYQHALTHSFEARYYGIGLSVGGGMVIVRSYAIKDSAPYALSNVLVSGKGSGSNSSNDNNSAAINSKSQQFNSTVVGQIIDLSNGVNNQQNRTIIAGDNIAGKYAVFSSIRTSDAIGRIGSNAAIWGTSSDGRQDIMVSIYASNLNIEQLMVLAKGLGLQK